MTKLITKKRIAGGVLCFYLLLAVGIYFSSGIFNLLDGAQSNAAPPMPAPARARTFASSHVLEIAHSAVESDVSIESVQEDVFAGFVNTDRILSLPTDAFHATGSRPILHDYKQDAPPSPAPIWDALASIQANEKSPSPLGGSKKKPQSSTMVKTSCGCPGKGIRWD